MNNNSEKNKLKSDELDQFVLDRLVDNDLSQEEYREVLRLVETKPDGWQKLALAFLESQALEVELSALHLDAELSELELGGTDGSSRLPRRHGRWFGLGAGTSCSRSGLS